MSLFARWLQRPAWVGIDIAPDAVRLLQLARDGDGIQVTHYACEPLSPGVMIERRIADSEAVGAAIAQARLHSGTRARHAVVALGPPAAMLRLVSVPVGLNETELEAQLELEAIRHLSAASIPPHLDFAVLGLSPDDPNRIQVLLALAHAAVVGQYVAALKIGGLNIAAIDVELLALVRALDVLGGYSLDAGQLADLVGPSSVPPRLANPLAGCTLAGTVPARAIALDASALMLASGLALRGMPA